MSEQKKTERARATRVLVVDDEEGMRNYLVVVLRKAGLEVAQAPDGMAAYEMLCREEFDVVLEDLKMPRLDGLGLLKRVKEDFPGMQVVVMTAFSSWESAVEAMRLGAFNYIRKPFDNDEIRAIVKRAAEVGETIRRRERDAGKSGRGKEPHLYRHIIGNTPDIRRVQELIRRIAPTDSTVCISGESGTGKELVARALHYHSARRHGPFIAVNCAAFTDPLLESELFGHVKGAFTGAAGDKPGLFEVAAGGTFFLDEVLACSKQLQTKLLRTLEEREIKPVGATKTVKIDVRIVTASNKNIEEEVARGNFREDLFYRLNVIPVKLPPLRERKGDIPFLVGHFLAKYGAGMKKPVETISKEALDVLFEHDWPGNIRELDNAIQRAVALAPGNEITVAELTDGSLSTRRSSGGSLGAAGCLPSGVDGDDQSDCWLIPRGGIRLEDQLDDVEKAYITEALRRTGNVVTRAADLLHINVRALRYRIRKLELSHAGDGSGCTEQR